MKENAINDFFDSSINDVTAIEDSITNILPEEDAENEFDVDNKTADEIKASAEMHYVLYTSQDILVNGISAFMKELLFSYSSLFSLCYYQLIRKNYYLNNETNDFSLKYETQKCFHLYFTLNREFKVNKFHSFNNSLISLCHSLRRSREGFSLNITKNNEPANSNIKVKYTINFQSFANLFNNNICNEYFNACLFFANGKFNEYVERYTLKNIINKIHSKFIYFNNFKNYLNQRNILYFFVPLIYTDYVIQSDYLALYQENVYKGYIVEDLSNMTVLLNQCDFHNSNIKIPDERCQYNIDDYKDSLKSSVISYNSDYGRNLIRWHEKPFYLTIQALNSEYLYKAPAVAVEVTRH